MYISVSKSTSHPDTRNGQQREIDHKGMKSLQHRLEQRTKHPCHYSKCIPQCCQGVSHIWLLLSPKQRANLYLEKCSAIPTLCNCSICTNACFKLPLQCHANVLAVHRNLFEHLRKDAWPWTVKREKDGESLLFSTTRKVNHLAHRNAQRNSVSKERYT